ncbi:hypothetical protein RB595_008655 [Gaeumannomyces hyphopodioides]
MPSERFLGVSVTPIYLRLFFSPVSIFIFIYTIILLCADIPVPEFKNAVIMLLCSTMVTNLVLTPICLIPSRILGIICTGISVALSTATLAIVCVRWRQALEIADEWSVPFNVDPSRIPGNANPDLWKLVRNQQYGSGVIVGAAVDLALNVLCALIVWGGACALTMEHWQERRKANERKTGRV